MSRFRYFISGLTSAYGLMVANLVYTLASVPLALHYLTHEQFGLWAVTAQVSGYLALVDLGMSSSIARLLIDDKDDPTGAAYGELVSTGWIVLAVQGALVGLLGLLLARPLTSLLDVPDPLAADFQRLMVCQAVVVGVGFMTRMFGHILYAHQRMDLQNYAHSLGMLGGLVALAVSFPRAGVFSLIVANASMVLVSTSVSLAACLRLNLFPWVGPKGRPTWARFRIMFCYGWDILLVAVGTQLILASQTIVISRQLGLGAAALWAIGTKPFTVISLATWRIFDSSMPALAEMVVRREWARLRERFRGLLVLTTVASGVGAAGLAICNADFVALWTRGRMTWGGANDLLLAAWSIVLAFVHVHGGLILTTKSIGALRYIYLLEGVTFVAAAYMVAPRWGISGILGVSILSSLAFSGTYCVGRTMRYFGLSLGEVGGRWALPLLRVLAVYAPLSLVLYLATRHMGAVARLAILAVGLTGLGGFLVLRLEILGEFQTELARRLPAGFRRLLLRA